MRKALIVGINDYPGSARLSGCVNDAQSVSELLDKHADGSPNFDIMLCTSVKRKDDLKKLVVDAFKDEDEISLFYFSGHGCITDTDGYIVTPDFTRYDEGLSMDEILKITSLSPARHKIVILDCCHAGAMGTPAFAGNTAAYLEKGVVILASSRSTEVSMEIGGGGVFTSLLVDALKGGAADIAGDVTPGSVYSYVEKALGAWKQRPVFKANIVRSVCLRKATPFIPTSDLRLLKEYFTDVSSEYPLDPSYEYTTNGSDRNNINVFKVLRKMYSLGLVEPVGEEYMYYAAINSKSCRLTSLGTYYWKLIQNGRL
jgi:hypothetical protein